MNPMTTAPDARELIAAVRLTGATTSVIVVDAGVADTPLTGAVMDGLRSAGHAPRRIVLSGAGDSATVANLSRELGRAGCVVAMGGGSLIDQAKLGSLLADAPKAARYLDVRQRVGLVLLPAALRRERALVAVPTTVGTGAEVSSVACLHTPRGRRLVHGLCLRPDAAVLLPDAAATLPVHLVAEGVVEALFRTVAPYIGDPRRLPEPDVQVERAAAQLVRLGQEVRAAVRTGGRPDPSTLREIVQWGALSHSPMLHEARTPFSARGWYLANELSIVLGVRKNQAICALLPEIWRATLAGDIRLGSSARLRHMWSVLSQAAAAGWPSDPAEGIEQLLDDWWIDRRLVATPDQLTVAAHRAIQAWGGGLPMLAGLRREDVRDLYAAATASSASAAVDRGGIDRGEGEEGNTHD